jgi:dihydromethanopterin reductase
MADVRAICAIGMSGQLGLRGLLPWEGDRRPEFQADVARFFDITRGHVLMAGRKTLAALPDFAREDRTVVVLERNDVPQAMFDRFPGRVIYIGGGPPVWDVYAPFIRHWDITRLPYDGEADRWFDPRWLLTGAHVRSGGS